jgi:sulfatase maturation enzyme AslB (radical SAM superfamily)
MDTNTHEGPGTGAERASGVFVVRLIPIATGQKQKSIVDPNIRVYSCSFVVNVPVSIGDL